MTATDKSSVIDALIKKQEDEYVDWTARAFHELASVARLRKIVLRDLKADIEQAIEADKQAYAAQQVSSALEKVKAQIVAFCNEDAHRDFKTWQVAVNIGQLIDNLSESFGEKEKA